MDLLIAIYLIVITNKVNFIFFDLGWTLINTEHAHLERVCATQTILARHGYSYSAHQLMQLCADAASQFAPKHFQGLIDLLNLPPSIRDEVYATAKYNKQAEFLYNGVSDVLDTCAHRFRLGILANQSSGTIQRLISWGIHRYFSVVITSADYGRSKPAIEIFAAAQQAAKCRPNEILMVGDRIDNDIGPAKSLGWNTARVINGFARLQRPRHLGECPDYSIPTIRELLTLGVLPAADHTHPLPAGNTQ